MPTSERTSRPTVLLTAGALLALPVALTLALPDWYFSSPHGIDPWLYNGFFRHLDLFASSLYPNTYYGTRLAWILPGHAAYALFEPETAALVLHVTFYLAAVMALFYAASQVAGREIALGCAVAFGLFLPSARGLGDDYIAAGVVTYSIIGMALAIASVRSRYGGLLALASGVATGAMFHSNIAAALMLPTILIWMLPAELSRAALKSSILRAAAWLAGAVFCTIMLGELSVRHGGTRLFFVRSFTWWQENNATNPWDQKGWAWVFESPWAFFPVLTAVACCLALGRKRRRAALDHMKVKALVAFAYIVGLFLVWDLLGSSAVLYWPFYTSWLMPVSFLALGAVVLGTLPPGRFDGGVLAVGAVLLLLSMAQPDWIPLPFKTAGLLVALGAALACGIVQHRAAAAMLAAVLLVHVNMWASFTGFFSPSEPRIDAFRAVNEALRHIEPRATTRQPRFLYNEQESGLASYYSATAGIYLWGYSIVTRAYPAIDAPGVQMLAPGTLATIFARRPETLEGIDKALAPHSIRAELVTTKGIATAHGTFYLTFFRTLDPAN